MKRGRVLKLAIPILASGFTGQIVGLSSRIAIGYEAIEIGLSATMVLVLTATFSFLPIFLTLQIGRFTDRNGAGPVVMAGACSLFLGAALPLILAPSLGIFLLAMSLLGIGQTFQIAALQAEISLIGRGRQRDSMIGGFMVYQSLGQVLAPLLLTAASFFLVPKPHVVLLPAAVIIGLLQLVLAVQISRHARQPTTQAAPVPIGEIVSTSGIVWLAVSGSLCVATQEMTYMFLPIVATERSIDPAFVGIMLGAFSIMQLLARAVYARVSGAMGRERLMTRSLLVSAAIFCSFAIPMGANLMAVLLAFAGLSLGFAVTCSVSLTMQLAPVRAKGTTLSLRLAVNRTGQFAMPLVSALATPWFGVGGVFLTCGVVIGICAPFLPAGLRNRR
ncbi:MAG: MFS transporter [Sedimentitalea sp.]|uniref:MFS transporter n=1 Tax=Sedimentitalea sp. TaxID=2048915 RepID=UPI0032667AB1